MSFPVSSVISDMILKFHIQNNIGLARCIYDFLDILFFGIRCYKGEFYLGVSFHLVSDHLHLSG